MEAAFASAALDIATREQGAGLQSVKMNRDTAAFAGRGVHREPAVRRANTIGDAEQAEARAGR